MFNDALGLSDLIWYIIIGVVFLILLCLCICCCACSKKRARRRREAEANQHANPMVFGRPSEPAQYIPAFAQNESSNNYPQHSAALREDPGTVFQAVDTPSRDPSFSNASRNRSTGSNPQIINNGSSEVLKDRIAALRERASLGSAIEVKVDDTGESKDALERTQALQQHIQQQQIRLSGATYLNAGGSDSAGSAASTTPASVPQYNQVMLSTGSDKSSTNNDFQSIEGSPPTPAAAEDSLAVDESAIRITTGQFSDAEVDSPNSSNVDDSFISAASVEF